jgi:hypothetical protein
LGALVKIVAVLVLVLSLDLHWALLQTVAWTGMFINYSSDASFKEAVAKTFDGNHPCRLCKAIKKSKSEETKQKHQSSKPCSKLDLGLIWQPTRLNFNLEHDQIPAFNSSALSRTVEPLKPRPRRSFDGNSAHA